jgi:hypothetical protein
LPTTGWFDDAVQDRLQGIFAAFTWILPLIFGMSGFAIGRNRLLWVVLVTLLPIYGLYCFVIVTAFFFNPF